MYTRNRFGKRKSTGTDGESSPKKQRQNGDSGAGLDAKPLQKSGIELLTTVCYRRLVHFLDDCDVDSLAQTSRTMKQHMESDGIWRTRFERLFDREYDEKLALASNWKQLYKWQRASISYTDTRSYDQPVDQMVYMDTGMYGIKKLIPTKEVLFVLDHSGALHKYEHDIDEWTHGILWNVVDVVTDATTKQRHRNSLFVLSQSETLRRERPKLIKFHQFEKVKNDPLLPASLFDFEKKLRHWHPNGAPRSGDRVDVFRVDEGDLRRVFKMTFQQAHRFTALQVSNRNYNKTEEQNQGDDVKRHINELQLLTTKGRVWSLTVNEPELIAQGGGAQVALKNITSRFDKFYTDGTESGSEKGCHVYKIFNGKYISALLDRSGDLLVFSDKNEEIEKFFPNLNLIETQISKETESKRKSAIINIGCEIVDVSISTHHMLIIDCMGRLWSVGRNRTGQLGLCTRCDQSKPKMVPLPRNVKKVISAGCSETGSVILTELNCGRKKAFACGSLDYSDKFNNLDIEYDDRFLFSTQEQNDPPRIKHHVSKFSPLCVRLSKHTAAVRATSGQVCFIKKNDLDEVKFSENIRLNKDIQAQCCHCQHGEFGLSSYTTMESFMAMLRQKVSLKKV